MALRAMLDRIHMPHLPPREVLLDGDLVVRKSCGAAMFRQRELRGPTRGEQTKRDYKDSAAPQRSLLGHSPIKGGPNRKPM